MGVKPTIPKVSGKWDEALMQAITFPEEDRGLFTATSWHGEYRWFRSPNVICLEHYRSEPDAAPKRGKPAA